MPTHEDGRFVHDTTDPSYAGDTAVNANRNATSFFAVPVGHDGAADVLVVHPDVPRKPTVIVRPSCVSARTREPRPRPRGG